MEDLLGAHLEESRPTPAMSVTTSKNQRLLGSLVGFATERLLNAIHPKTKSAHNKVYIYKKSNPIHFALSFGSLPDHP